jgi:hypothetical protein
MISTSEGNLVSMTTLSSMLKMQSVNQLTKIQIWAYICSTCHHLEHQHQQAAAAAAAAANEGMNSLNSSSAGSLTRVAPIPTRTQQETCTICYARLHTRSQRLIGDEKIKY